MPIIVCRNVTCGAKLNVPAGRNLATVVCPKCKAPQIEDEAFVFEVEDETPKKRDKIKLVIFVTIAAVLVIAGASVGIFAFGMLAIMSADPTAETPSIIAFVLLVLMSSICFYGAFHSAKKALS